MLTINDQKATNIVDFFSELPDPRSEIKRLHKLGDVIVICICAVLANAECGQSDGDCQMPNGPS